QTTSAGGVRARLRRVAGCATPSGSAGHAGETANLKLTFHLDHSAGADHLWPPRNIALSLEMLAEALEQLVDQPGLRQRLAKQPDRAGIRHRVIEFQIEKAHAVSISNSTLVGCSTAEAAMRAAEPRQDECRNEACDHPF